MGLDGQAVLAVVPARGGSRGISRKNLLVVGGETLVGRAVTCALATPCVDVVLVSTDDREIADAATDCGAVVLGLRPPELSGDLALSVDVWKHAWLVAEEHFRQIFDLSALIQPTSPLRTPEDIEQTLAAVGKRGHKAAATVSRNPAHFTPEKTLRLGEDGRLQHYLPHGSTTIRQLIPSYFHCNGACYATQRSHVVEDGLIVDGDCAAVLIDRPMISIDDHLDLLLVERLLI